MSCISEILKLKGDKDYFVPIGKNGKPWVVIEGGGVYRDMEYLIVVTPLAHRCGYVALMPGHPLNNFHNEEYNYPDLICHGGITFFSDDHGLKELLQHPCSDKWVGFDCAHCYDLPDVKAAEMFFDKDRVELARHQIETFKGFGAKTRSFKYVEKECKKIINQLWKQM